MSTMTSPPGSHGGEDMQAGKSQRSVLALVITCALILGFGIPLIPLVGVDSAEGTEVSAASDVATVSAENSLQNGSFEQPDVYQYREPAMFRIGNPPRLQATSKSAVSSKTATETMTPCTCAPARKWPRPKAANSASRPRRTATIRSTSGSPPHKARNTDGP